MKINLVTKNQEEREFATNLRKIITIAEEFKIYVKEGQKLYLKGEPNES